MPFNNTRDSEASTVPAGLADPAIAQILAARIQTISPEERAILRDLVTPQTAAVVYRLLPELRQVAPRLTATLPGQQNVLPSAASPEAK